MQAFVIYDCMNILFFRCIAPQSYHQPAAHSDRARINTITFPHVDLLGEVFLFQEFLKARMNAIRELFLCGAHCVVEVTLEEE